MPTSTVLPASAVAGVRPDSTFDIEYVGIEPGGPAKSIQASLSLKWLSLTACPVTSSAAVTGSVLIATGSNSIRRMIPSESVGTATLPVEAPIAETVSPP